MKKIFLLFAITLMFGVSIFGQAPKYNKKKTLTFMSYNVENLFDTIDTPDVNDSDFTPESELNWNTAKYQKKLKSLAEVISKVNSNELPEMIGLCEIENRGVLEDLVKQKSIEGGNYQIVHENSPDKRGIDVAFLYRPAEFKYIIHRKIHVNLADLTDYEVRDILYIKGIIAKKDTLHIFINHWKSRSGGEEKTEPQRIRTAEILRFHVDSLLKINKNSDIIIAGDFNDEPTNKSLENVLGATNKPTDDLYNLLYEKSLKGDGTHSFKGNWNMLDNLIVSRHLMSRSAKWNIDSKAGTIFKADFIMYKNLQTGESSPSRTYVGKKYFGGYSDHLPVYFMLNR